jgi:hypothetical protein
MEKLKELGIESRLTKIEVINQSNYLSVGDSISGFYFEPPEVGYSFVFFCDHGNGPFKTSTVMEIIDQYSFKTRNTLYYLIDKVNDRDIKIEELLKQKDTI